MSRRSSVIACRVTLPFRFFLRFYFNSFLFAQFSFYSPAHCWIFTAAGWAAWKWQAEINISSIRRVRQLEWGYKQIWNSGSDHQALAPLHIYSKTNFELQIDIDMTSLWQGCAARTTRERVAQNFRTSFAFECELRAPHSRCFCVCSCVCVFAKQLTFVLARASGDPFAQIRLIKVPLFLCADSTRRTLSGSQKHSQQEPHKMAVLAIK